MGTLDPNVLSWLLEPGDPSPRYLALRHLLGRPEHDPEVIEARAAIQHSRQVQDILAAQYPAGYWVKPDQGYSPRYRATTWQVVFLADLGVAPGERTARACEHVLAVTFRPDYRLFCAYKHSTGLFPSLNGDLLRALCQLGYGEHPTVSTVAGALAERILQEGWICVRNGTRPRDKRTWQPCIWGCVKVLRGLAALPRARYTRAIEQAIASGVAYLLSHDLAADQRPALVPDPSHWLDLGFPLGYGSDLLEALLALVELGESRLPAPYREQLASAIRQRCGPDGRWPLDYAPQNTWTDFGVLGEPNKWVTQRALQALAWLADP